MDSFGRPSLLESKGDLYALAPIDVPNSTLIERTTQRRAPKEIPLPEAAVIEEAPVELAPDIIDTKRTAFKWPKDAATRFSEEVRNGYIFDHELTPAEKKAYIATKPDLPFASRLYIPDSEIIVSGEDQELVGEDLTKFKEWSKQLVDRFIADKGKLFGSMAPNGGFTLSPSELVDETPTRVIGTKSFMPTICSTGQNPISKMKIVAKFIDVNGVGIPGGLAGAPLCAYLELLAREQHNIAWYTPEEMKVIGMDVNKNAIKKGLK